MVSIIRPRVDYMSRIKVASGALALIDFRLASKIFLSISAPLQVVMNVERRVSSSAAKSLVMRMIGCVGYTTGRFRSI